MKKLSLQKELDYLASLSREAMAKPLKFINTFEMKKAFDKLSKKLGSSVTKDISSNSIKFVNDATRKEAFNILGKEYVKKVTNWKGPSVLANIDKKAEKPAWDEVLSVMKDFELAFKDFKKDVESKSYRNVERWLTTFKEDAMFVIKEIKARKKELMKTGGNY